MQDKANLYDSPMAIVEQKHHTRTLRQCENCGSTVTGSACPVCGKTVCT